MKNATVYEKKIKKLLSSMSRKSQPAAPKGIDCFTRLIEAILQADAQRKVAASVLNELHAEFLDYNELRVAPMKDITDCMPREFWGARDKADAILRSLSAIFDRTSSMSMEHLEKMPKRDLRKYLAEIGLSPYAASLVTLTVFGGHAVPVDQFLVDALENEECIEPGSELADVQGFLERVIPQKDAWSAHEFFRDFMEKNYKALLKKRKELAALAPPPAPKPPPPPLPIPVPPPLPELDEEGEIVDATPAPRGGQAPKETKKARPGRGGKPAKPSKPAGRK